MAEGDAAATLSHITHSPSCSVQRLRDDLGFVPKHSSIEAVAESVAWLIENKRIPGVGPVGQANL